MIGSIGLAGSASFQIVNSDIQVISNSKQQLTTQQGEDSRVDRGGKASVSAVPAVPF